MIRQWRSLRKEAVLLVLLLGALQACSGFPRIVVLHDPLTPQEHVTLGESYQAQSNTELAVREFQAALRQQSDYVPALIALGNLSFEAGALQEAEDSYRRALDAVPHQPAASNNLAMVYLLRGDRLDEAERLAKDALAQGGALRPYVLDTLAKIYMRQERYQEARTALEEAVTAAPSENKLLHERLAQSQRELAVAFPASTKP
jgi:tetratricopeptide (TPR) repeat protein